MKTEQVIKEMTEIRDEYVLEAKPEKKRKAARWGWIAAAAVFALAAGGVGLWALTRPKAEPAQDPGQIRIEAPATSGQAQEMPAPEPSEGPAPEEPSGQTAAWQAASHGDDRTEPASEKESESGQPPAETLALSELPLLTLPDYETGGMGFEGYLAHTIDELENGNPWKEADCPARLPVYVNHSYDPVGMPCGLDEASTRDRMTEAAAKLELSLGEAEAVYELPGDAAEERFTHLKAEADGLTVWAWADGRVEFVWGDSITGSGGLALPEDAAFPRGSEPVERARTTMEYLMQTYTDRVGLQNSRAALFGDYTFYGERLYSYAMYDAGETMVQAILNFAFRKVQFGYNEDGTLNRIRLMDGLAAAEKLGDYPIISPAQAAELLNQGHYQTSVPHALTADDLIVKVELVYRSGALEQMLLPYYRFYVDLTGVDDQFRQTEQGLHTFGAYYVPAVDPAYIENLPTYDGSFN